jgi:Ca2+-binding EF-hand superfamily protein
MDTTKLSGAEFKELLRLNLGIVLTSKEAGAMLKHLDKKDLGYVDCKAFLVDFNRLGRIQRQKYEEQQEKLKKHHELVMAQIQEPTVHLLEEEVLEIQPHSEADFESFKRKINRAAIYFEVEDAERVKHIFGNKEQMNIREFKNFLQSFFNLGHLSPGEIDVAAKVFDLDSDGIISCADFLSTFYRIQWRAKARQKRVTERKIAMRAQKEAEYWRKREADALALLQTHVVWPALDPITHSSATSPIHHQDSMSLGSGSYSLRKEASVSSHRSARKQMVEDSFSAGRFAEKLAATSESVINLFPNASPVIKDFILELERKEDSYSQSFPNAAASSSSAASGKHKKTLTKKQEETLPPIVASSTTASSSIFDDDDDDSNAQLAEIPAEMLGWENRPRSVHSSRQMQRPRSIDNENDRRAESAAMSVDEEEDLDQLASRPTNTINASSDLMTEMGMLLFDGEEDIDDELADYDIHEELDDGSNAEIAEAGDEEEVGEVDED